MINKICYIIIIIFFLFATTSAEELKIKVKPQPQTKPVKIDKQKPDEKKATPAKGPLRLPLKHFK